MQSINFVNIGSGGIDRLQGSSMGSSAHMVYISAISKCRLISTDRLKALQCMGSKRHRAHVVYVC